MIEHSSYIISKNKHYETDRLILRNWQVGDIEAFINLNQDSRVMEFFPNCLTAEETLKMIKRLTDKFRSQGFGFYACELKQNQHFIGFVGLNIPDFTADFTPCVEIGWRIAYEYWGLGLALEAAHKCLNIGFNEYNLPEIVSFTTKDNLRSQRVMQKLGMSHSRSDDFYHPILDSSHPLALHVLYRLSKTSFISQSNNHV